MQAILSMKLPELRAKCKELGLTGYSKLNKAQLVSRLQDNNPQDNLSSVQDFTAVPISAEPVLKPTANAKSKALPKRIHISAGVIIPASPTKSAKVYSPTSKTTPQILSIASPSTSDTPSRKLPPAFSVPLQSTSPRTEPTFIQIQPSTSATGSTQSDPRAVPLIKRPADTLSVSAPETARPVKQIKSGPLLKTKTLDRRPLVLARTRPLQDPLTPTVSPICHNVPGRQEDESNTSFLASHFTLNVLHQLRPHSLPTLIMHQSIINGDAAPFTVALGFYISRLHTAFQMGSGEAWSIAAGGRGLLSPDISRWPVITECQVVAGDVWSVRVGPSSYFCIGSTGEVIHEGDTEPRPDWAAYLASPKPLLDLIKTKDSIDYPRGVFRGFRGGQEEQAVAERVALSSCVLQSYSGQSLPLLAMEAEWLNQPSAAGPSKGQVELYLPESHQILSAYLTPHRSVAIIQRSGGYSQYVLRETGQIIGDEDGIAPFWQGILSCDSRGKDKPDETFWRGWEERCVMETLE